MPTHEQFLEIYRFVQRAVTRHWRKSVAVFAIVALLSAVGTLVMPRSYYSEARLFVRFGRENQVDPTATSGQMVALYESRESEINSLIEILKSRSILDRVVAALGPEYVLYGKKNGGTPNGQGIEAPPSLAHQRAVAKLEKEMFISAPRKSNIITVACKAASPVAAQQIVAKLIEVYLEEHVRVHRSPGTLEFFQEQAGQSLVAWQSAADTLRDAKNRLGIVTIEGRRKHLEDEIAENEVKSQANQADVKTSQAKIASLRELIASLPEKLTTSKAQGPSAAFDGMRQTLYQLESQEHDLSARMQDGHPRLAAMRQQVTDLREILHKQPEDRLQSTEGINPTRQALELSLLNEQSQADSLVARHVSLATIQQRLQGDLQQLNKQVADLEQLQQRVTLAEANHKEYSQKLEQARISRSLDDEQISSLTVVQPASYVATATGLRRSLVLALGLAVAIGSGLGVALLAAWLNPVLTTAGQIASVLDLPLTGIVPAATLRMTAAA
jgi:uncharacterized protein involved in exopolysaccharide biosynthesis